MAVACDRRAHRIATMGGDGRVLLWKLTLVRACGAPGHGGARGRVKGLVYTSTLDVVVPLARCEGVEGETLAAVEGH